jgi:hypothetical protein
MRVIDLRNALNAMPQEALVRVVPSTLDEYSTVHRVVVIDETHVWLIGAKP